MNNPIPRRLLAICRNVYVDNESVLAIYRFLCSAAEKDSPEVGRKSTKIFIKCFSLLSVATAIAIVVFIYSLFMPFTAHKAGFAMADDPGRFQQPKRRKLLRPNAS